MACGGCAMVLNVPGGATQFRCPACDVVNTYEKRRAPAARGNQRLSSERRGWCAGCGKAERQMCEGCGLKRPNYGLKAEGKARWCVGCGETEGAVRIYAYIGGAWAEEKQERLAKRAAVKVAKSATLVSRKSEFAGVTWNKHGRKWTAQIRHGGKTQTLGAFDDEEAAAHVVDTEARRLRGAEAHGGQMPNVPRTRWRLNFPTAVEERRAEILLQNFFATRTSHVLQRN